MQTPEKGSDAKKDENWELVTVKIPNCLIMPDQHLMLIMEYFHEHAPGYLHSVLDRLIVEEDTGSLDSDEKETLLNFMFMLRSLNYGYSSSRSTEG